MPPRRPSSPAPPAAAPTDIARQPPAPPSRPERTPAEASFRGGAGIPGESGSPPCARSGGARLGSALGRSRLRAAWLGLLVEEQHLADDRLDGLFAERLADEKSRLGLAAGGEPFREGGDEDHRHGQPAQEI